MSDVVDILEAVTIVSFSQERVMREHREGISILCIYLFILHDLILKEKYIGKKLKASCFYALYIHYGYTNNIV